MAQGRKVKLTPKATEDLENLYFYGLTRFGEHVADEYSSRIYDALDALATHSVGRSRPEIHPSLFSFPVAMHSIFYHSCEGEIVIVRVLHHSQDAVRPHYWQ